MGCELKKLGPLAEQFPATGLFGAWLRGLPIPAATDAGSEWEAALRAAGPVAKAPLWRVLDFAQLLSPEFQALPGGPAVVVTGQQPGFLGGPLLTLYKIATAIAAARQRTAAGRPTVAVFWSGDDDDDLAEALAPVGWDRGEQGLWRSEFRKLLQNPATQRGILAERTPDEWAAPVLEKFRSADQGDELRDSLTSLLARAVEVDQRWGEKAALVQRVFAGTGLVVIRGHDVRLHELAAPLYGKISGRLEELAEIVRQRGAKLAAAGFPVQISDRSLARPMFRTRDGRREPALEFSGADAGELRPGVMLRSPVQDWLLQPSAVVVGPGELAYLRQLDPLYAALDLPRSPLVPRLSGWVLPAGDLSPGLRELMGPTAPVVGDETNAWADEVVDLAKDKIVEKLVTELHIDSARAAGMADRRGRRFHKGVVAMFRAEVERQEQERLAAAPQWVLPAGQRQERSLGFLSALDLWGGELVTAILAAADQHLDLGKQNNWREFAITVPEGTVSK